MQVYFSDNPSYHLRFIASDNKQLEFLAWDFHLDKYLLNICEAELTAVFTVAACQCI